jgi:hypothetical protein
MPHFKIVVANVHKAHQALVASYKNFPRTQRRMQKGPPTRTVGTVHATADSECPDEMPNCRNCGDPEHLETCQAAGHCPYCGTRHGIAPDAVLAEKGYEMVEIDRPPTP